MVSNFQVFKYRPETYDQKPKKTFSSEYHANLAIYSVFQAFDPLGYKIAELYGFPRKNII